MREIEKKLGPPIGGNAACTDAETSEIVARLEKEAFDDGRVKVLESASAGRTFVCQQVAKLVKTFTFGDGQVKAVKVLLPRISDRENFARIYDVVTFESDRERIKKLEKAAR